MSLARKVGFGVAATAVVALLGGCKELIHYSPTVVVPQEIVVAEGETVRFPVELADADGDELTVTINNNPPEATFNAGTSEFVVTDRQVDFNTHHDGMTLTVSDGINETISSAIRVTFKDKDIPRIITKAADRLLTLQNANGSWDWVVTNATGPTADTYLNIAGVTAHPFIDAFKLTGDTKYLTAAKKAGDFIVSGINALPVERHFNAFNMVFLSDLAEASGDSVYSDFVSTKMGHLKNNVTAYGGGMVNISTDAVSGLTAAELVAAENVIRGTAPHGIKPWDLYHFVRLAKDSGDDAYATGVANGVQAFLNDGGYIDSVNEFELGLAAGVIALEKAGMSYDSLLERLLLKQGTNGSFANGSVQGTAYALMALMASGNVEEAKEAALSLRDNFGYAGPAESYFDGWLETDGSEISEVTSEAAKALALMTQL